MIDVGHILPLLAGLSPGQQYETQLIMSPVAALDEKGAIPEKPARDKGNSAE